MIFNSHKNNSDTFLTMWYVFILYIIYTWYMDKELGVGNSMILYLVSLYWYSTDSYTSLYASVRSPMHLRLLTLTHSLCLCLCACASFRASAHNYLTLKFSLSCLFALALVRPCGREFIFINFLQSWVIRRMKIKVWSISLVGRKSLRLFL